jgi:hypothetical protein
VKLASQPLVPTCLPFSCAEKSSSSLFISPLFSQPYELLFPQALCFGNHLNCPGVWEISALYLATRHSPLATSPLFSIACSLFGALASLFQSPVLCFQQLPASFCKTPGVGGILPLALRTSAPGACPDPVGAPLRYSYIFGVFRYGFGLSINQFTSHGADLFQLSTVDCRLPFHNAKIHSNSL